MRLTKKTKGSIYMYNFDTNCDDEIREQRSIETHNKIVNKLGSLEDIEEKQGIELITLFNALENGFYYYKDGKIAHTSDEESYIFLSAVTSQMCIEVKFGNLITAYFYFKNCGETWALTKEELEK